MKHLNIISILLISVFVSSCSRGISYEDIYKGNTTFGVLTIKPYDNMTNFLKDIGFKYDKIKTLKDYMELLYYTSATPSEAYLRFKEEDGVYWTDDFKILETYKHGDPDYYYYVGSYQQQPVVYRTFFDTELLVKEKTKSVRVEGNLSKSSIRLSFMGLYDKDNSVDNHITFPIYIPCILVDCKKIF